MSNTINTANIVEINAYYKVLSLQSYDDNFRHDAEEDFRATVEKEYPDWNEDMIDEAVEKQTFDKENGNTVSLVYSRPAKNYPYY